jgi:hypothetical protein
VDYGKSGNAKNSKDSAHQRDPSAVPGKMLKVKGSTKIPNPRPTKEQLLARLKAAAEAAKTR